MLLHGALASLRAVVGDTGVFLTSFGEATADAGDRTIPVDDLSMITIGGTIRIGTGDTAESAVVTGKSAAVGDGEATLAAPLALDHGEQTVIASAMVADDDYAKFIALAILQASTYRPRSRQTTVELVADTGTYELPADFLSPDRESFDEAIGGEGDHRATDSFYAIIYRQSTRFASSGWGGAQGFGTFGVGGMRAASPNDFPQGAQGAVEYRFLKVSPPMMAITPPPTAAQTLTFWYAAAHTQPTAETASTLPADAKNLMLLYATYLACRALATGACRVLKYELNGEKIDQSKAPGEYSSQAKQALAEFEADTKFRPIGMSG